MGKKPELVFTFVLLGAIITLTGSAQLLFYQVNGTISGLIGLVSGAMMLIAAFMLNSSKEAVVKQWSSVALIAAFLSTAAFFNVYPGFILAMVGSLMGITYGDVIDSKDIFLFVFIGGVAMFVSSLLIIGSTPTVVAITVGTIGAVLGVFAIRYSGHIYTNDLKQLQLSSSRMLTIGIMGMAVSMFAIMFSLSMLLTVGIAAGTLFILSGSYSGAVRPSFMAAYNEKGTGTAATKKRRR